MPRILQTLEGQFHAKDLVNTGGSVPCQRSCKHWRVSSTPRILQTLEGQVPYQGSCKHWRISRIRACVIRSSLCIPCTQVGTIAEKSLETMWRWCRGGCHQRTVLWKRLKTEGCIPPYESVPRRWFRIKTISNGNLDVTVHSKKPQCRSPIYQTNEMGNGANCQCQLIKPWVGEKSGPVEPD